jgi:type II secretion system protein H
VIPRDTPDASAGVSRRALQLVAKYATLEGRLGPLSLPRARYSVPTIRKPYVPHLACRIRRVPNVRGFSLLELLIVLVIFAIMASIAVPSFQSLRQHQQLTDASNELVAALRLARGEAIMREAEVTLSPATGKDWAQGWRIADEDKNTVVVHEPLPAQLSVGNENARSQIVFNALGYPPDGKANWRLSHAGLSDGASRQVCLTMTGRAYVAEPGSGCGS